MAVKVGDLYARLGMDTSDFEQGLKSTSRSLESLSDSFVRVGAAMSAAISLPIAGALGASAKTFSDFEASMNKVEALLRDFGNTSPEYLKQFKTEMDDLTKLTIELGQKTQYSSQQVADAMTKMASAGFSAQQIMAGLPGVLSLAASGQLALADAAEIAAAIMGGFGLQASEMGRVADILAKAASSSASTVEDLGFAFKYVGPVAKAAGLSLSETAAALEILANAGIRGEKAGTAIRNMISDLVNPSNEAAKLMAELGIRITDVSGKLLPLADIIDQFKKANIGVAEAFTIWGQRASDVLPLLAAGGDKIRSLTQDLQGAEGAAKRMADTMRRGVGGAWEEFTGSLETLGIAIGKLLAPAIEALLRHGIDLLNWVTDMATAFGRLPQPVQVAAGALVALVTATGPVLLALGGIAKAIPLVTEGLGLLAAAKTAVIAGFSSLGSTLANVAFAMKNGLVPALTGAELAVARVAQAAALAGAAFVGWQLGSWLRANIPAVREFGDAVGSAIDRVTGLGTAISYINGSQAKLKQANEDLAFSVQKLEAALRAKGVAVSQGSMSLEEYANKLRGMIATVNTAPQAVQNAGQAIAELKRVTDSVASISSKVSIGLDSAGMQKARAELEAYRDRIIEIQKQVEEAAKAGKISRGEQVQIEKQLAEAMSQVKSQLALVGGEAQTTSRSLGAVAKNSEEAEEAARRMKEAHQEAAQSLKRLRDILDDLPKDYASFKRMEEQGFNASAAIRQLQEYIRDLSYAYSQSLNPALTQHITTADLAIQKLRELQRAAQAEEMERGWQRLSEYAQKAASDLRNLAAPPELISSLTILGERAKETYGKIDEAYKTLGITSQYVLADQAAKTKEAFDVITKAYEDGKVTLLEYKQAYLAMLESQIAVKVNAGEDVSAMVANAKAVKDEIEKMVSVANIGKKQMDDLAVLGRQISTIISDMGKGLADAILSGRSLGEVMTNVFDQILRAVLRFVLEGMINGVIKWFKEADNQALLFGGNVLGIFGKIGEAIKGLFGGGGGAAAPSVPTLGTGGGGGGGTKGAGGGMAGAGGFMAWTNLFTGIADAIFGGLQYFQGRRIEKDVGRIEVTTREIFSQLLAIQDTLNKWLPGVDPAGNYQLDTIRVMTGMIHDELVTIKEQGYDIHPILQTLQEINTRLGAQAAQPRAALPSETRMAMFDEALGQTAKSAAEASDGLDDVATSARSAGDTQAQASRTAERATTSLADSMKNAAAYHTSYASDVGRSMEQVQRSSSQAGAAMDYASDAASAATTSLYELGDAAEGASASTAEYSRVQGGVASITLKTIDSLGEAVSRVADSIQSAGIRLLNDQFMGVQTYKEAPATTPAFSSPGGITWIPIDRNFTINVNAETSDGKRIANTIVTTLRMHGVDL